MMDQQQLTLVERIAHALEIFTGVSQREVGFSDAPAGVPTFIFVKNEGEYLWYQWNFDNNRQIPIAQKFLTGVITDLQQFDKEWQGKPMPKLRISVKADKNYIIQTGLDSVFARGFLLHFGELSSAQIGQAITIGVVPNDTSQGSAATVFCDLYADGERVIAEWDRDANPQDLLTEAQKRLGVEQRVWDNGNAQDVGPADPEPQRQQAQQQRTQQQARPAQGSGAAKAPSGNAAAQAWAQKVSEIFTRKNLPKLYWQDVIFELTGMSVAIDVLNFTEIDPAIGQIILQAAKDDHTRIDAAYQKVHAAWEQQTAVDSGEFPDESTLPF
jgi:hypothetical protein